ncbi:hypothetical protein ACWGK5_31635 [Rhodococcus qingshengii]
MTGRGQLRWVDALQGLIVEFLDGLGAIDVQIGDELVNVVSPLSQANSWYAMMYPCMQVVLFLAGSVIGGEHIPRDRVAEFTVTGTVADLHTALDAVVARLSVWVEVTVTDGVTDRGRGWIVLRRGVRDCMSTSRDPGSARGQIVAGSGATPGAVV